MYAIHLPQYLPGPKRLPFCRRHAVGIPNRSHHYLAWHGETDGPGLSTYHDPPTKPEADGQSGHDSMGMELGTGAEGFSKQIDGSVSKRVQDRDQFPEWYEAGRTVTDRQNGYGQAERLRVGRMVTQVAEQVEEGQAEREMTVWVCSFARTYSNRWAVRRLEDNHGEAVKTSESQLERQECLWEETSNAT